MPTNREEYFKAIKLENPYLNNVVIRSLLIVANSFDNDYKLTINFDEEIKNYDMYLSMLERVKNGEPYQYVIGKASFLGSDYYVDKNVLIPRQETEQLVLQTKELIKSKFINREIAICDMCTGSGIIGNELHKEFSKAKIYLTDISKEALEIAKKNTLSNSENLTFLLGSMVNPLIEKGIKLDVLVCNPPYIDKVEEIDKQVWEYEPHLALTAFPSTSLYEEIFNNYKSIMNQEFIMAFEIGEDMESSLTELVNKYFKDIEYKFEKDIYNKTRYLYIISNMKNDYKKASQVLLQGQVIGFATETVMGLGVVYNNKEAYDLLNKVKRRPEDKPYSLMIGDVNDIDKYAYISKDAQKLIDAFLPGSITILLPVKDSVPSWVTHGGSTIGIRVPSNEVALSLLKEVKLPLLVPSANRSGEKPCMTSNEVKETFKDEVGYVLEGDALGGLPSTLIDMTKETYKILREGPITKEMIDKVLGGE